LASPVTPKETPLPGDLSEVDASFTRVVNTDLAPIAVLAQCLDNQWVSQDQLAAMLANGWSLEDDQVAARRLVDARAEYLRSLLNAEQVVVNRGFFFNNPVVYQDFMRADERREAFVKLVNTRVLVPFLFDESSPGEPPRFARDAIGWPAWRHLLQETHLHCLRLSWDDAENVRAIRQLLSQRFRRFLGGLGVLDEEGLRTDLNLDESASAGLMKRLREVAVWAMTEDDVTRDTFYRRFVVADGSPPSLGRYDRGKPFAGELKQLADLRYNTNLPDAIDRYPLTPADSLHRTALQEERLSVAPREPTDPADLVAVLLRRRAFDLVQRPLHVPLTGLDLTHVWAARQTDDWHAYTGNLRGLLERPDEFDVRAQRVYDNYVALAGRLSEVVGDRRRDLTPEWVPVIRVVVEVVGATVSIVFTADPFVEVAGRVAEEVLTRASTAVVRFVIGHHDRRQARHQLGTGIDIMRLKFARTGDDWNELIARLRASGLPMRRLDDSGALEDDASIDGSDADEGPS
jgi:hypothetical protein